MYLQFVSAMCNYKVLMVEPILNMASSASSTDFMYVCIYILYTCMYVYIYAYMSIRVEFGEKNGLI